MAQLFRNNASTVLNGAIDDSTTTIVVADGSVFPTPTTGDWFVATLVGYGGGGRENAWEIVKITARSGNTLTAERAQEGTTAVAWGDGARIELRLTAGAVTALVQTSDARLSDAREWTAETVGQAEAEAGTATTRRAWTAQRVRQSVVAWWTGVLATATEWTATLTVNGIVSKKSIREVPVTGNAGTAYTINLANGTAFDLTLDQSNCNFTFPTATAGLQFTLLVTLGGAGRTYAFPASVRWDADGAPDISTVSGRTDRYVFQADGTYWLASAAGIGFNRS